eukprot:GHVU01199520.1.p1 GENE.GHVU01199520.1~~GHVU01199520.1.p1  ORF type:complete len:133 (+),score=14.98 GHVU01199520.1:691-1089(+)
MNPDEFLAQAEFLTEGIINSSPSKSKALERFPKLSKEVAAVVPSDFGNEDDNFAANGVDEHGLPIYTNEDITKWGRPTANHPPTLSFLVVLYVSVCAAVLHRRCATNVRCVRVPAVALNGAECSGGTSEGAP